MNERAVRAAALRRDLRRRFALANLDELLVIELLWQRLELGRERYGHLDLAKARDWSREESEELLDARIYQACAVLHGSGREVVDDRFDLSEGPEF